MKQKKKRVIDIQFITACISTSLVLLLLGSVVMVVLTAGRLSDHVRENLELSLLLNDEVKAEDVNRIVKYVERQRYTKEVRYISKEDILAEPALKILAVSEKAGVYAVKSRNNRQIFITGHSEYDQNTLAKEYFRDVNLGKEIAVPENYFPNDDPSQPPRVTWRAHANLLYSNWLNYFVYQTTPYDITDISNRAKS